ncbi:short-chain collagen C4-like [Babylonia areolata]|uniref:short-chain collagen C4-like n=1 Tax=Babylonia areolata TaxID=304850 RepID=UPI003FCFFED3
MMGVGQVLLGAAFTFYVVAAAKCSEKDLGAVVAQQNKAIMDLQKEQSAVPLQLQQLKQGLEKRIDDLEDRLDECKKGLQSVHFEVKSTQAEMNSTKADVGDLEDILKEVQQKLHNVSVDIGMKRGGSTYIRWGRKSCPADTDAKLVYTGIVGGKRYTEKGSGTNPLCLTLEPKYDGREKPATNGYLYGSEYEGIKGLHNHEVPCSVCHTNDPSTIMVPGTTVCPSGWTIQYSGFLASNYFNFFATQFLCVDGKPEALNASKVDSNGVLFYAVVSKCGSLPCPPYVADKVVTCVVCSK